MALNSKDVFCPHLFSFKNGPLKRLPFNKPPHVSFLDLSAEIRNIVYEYAVVMPFVIRNDDTSYKNDRKCRDRITACFNFMQTCRRVYKEASPVFWGCNTFLLQAQLIAPRPRPMVFGSPTDLPHLSKYAPWHVRVGKSHCRQIRRLTWICGCDKDLRMRYSRDWRRRSCSWSSLSDLLAVVTELTVVLDVEATALTRFPKSEDATDYVESLWIPEQAKLEKETFLSLVRHTSNALRARLLQYLQFFTSGVFPSLQLTRLGCMAGDCDDFEKVMTAGISFFQDLAAIVTTRGLNFSIAGVQDLGPLDLDDLYPMSHIVDPEISNTVLGQDDVFRYYATWEDVDNAGSLRSVWKDEHLGLDTDAKPESGEGEDQDHD